ncbi:unnamed protein product, partial [Ectocarpus sp. 12 AP-2014]
MVPVPVMTAAADCPVVELTSSVASSPEPMAPVTTATTDLPVTEAWGIPAAETRVDVVLTPVVTATVSPGHEPTVPMMA